MESANSPAVAAPSRNADNFTKSTYRIFDGMARHQRGLMYLIIAAFVVLVGAALVMGQKDKVSGEARNALFLAQKKYDAEMKALAPPAPKVEKKDPKAPPPPPPADDTEFKAFQEVVAKFPGTRAAYDAQMSLGHLYLDHGQSAQAESLLNGAVSDAPRGTERALALLAQGYAREAQGKLKEALDSFSQALATGEEAVKADALMSSARAYEGLHDMTNARATYEKVIAQLPNTEAARNAELYKSQAQ